MRKARCSCGAVEVSIGNAEPDAVVVCHCIACQRRTGSVFGIGVYYPKDALTITGKTKEFARDTDSGGKLRSHFCPECGTSVYWTVDKQPGRFGIAAGAFGDLSLPTPARSVWEETKHPWVDVTAIAQHFPKGRVT